MRELSFVDCAAFFVEEAVAVCLAFYPVSDILFAVGPLEGAPA